ncbi:RNA polymerase sigma-70 factor [Sphingobacterium alkalisoli]|uniref:RNA polymerase sigma-70 factor n=1 Tax=Sphingobacterium alkalisoli TaxID=1874115 RepID=A0A4U0H4Y7_9SPHI|nr:RNA polymerase sigma-70 factor [Sphingobacterium alkalisoli]TJY66797.1 RNA polymerase sigma-70 factor [Sphingobacterium alkalisoli]GGH14160.1 RNA polymerase sigma-70 factor [Sphingobacterium alkalisoli]
MRYSDYSILSDEILVDLIRQHDEKAFAVIYQRYSAPLYAHAYGFVHDREEIKDILQKVFVKIWDLRTQLPDQVKLSSYLYQTVKNAIINHIAHSKVVDNYLANISHYSKNYIADTDHHIREKQLQEIIDYEISQLPKKMREVFELSRSQHLTHKQIAEKLGITEKTVKNQITNALKLLRSKLPLLLFILAIIPNES